MRIFVLKMPAYHFLERNQYVSISETGDLVSKSNSRVRYFIKLNRDKNHWVYYRFCKEKNEFYEFIIDFSKSHLCLVHAGFIQVSKYNGT